MFLIEKKKPCIYPVLANFFWVNWSPANYSFFTMAFRLLKIDKKRITHLLIFYQISGFKTYLKVDKFLFKYR